MELTSSSWYAKQIAICIYRQVQAQFNEGSLSRKLFIYN